MAKHKKKIRIGLMVTLIVCVILCPLAWGGYSVHYGAHAQEKRDDPIEFTPHVTEIVITVTPEPVLKATVGSGQTFDSDNKPELVTVHGDDDYGWGDIKDKSGLVLIWITDEDGTHYIVVDKSDELFNGYSIRDENGERTGVVIEDGFEDFIRAREETLRIFNNSRAMGAGASSVTIIAGLLFASCPATLGAGCVAAFITGTVALGEAIRESRIREDLTDDIKELERNIQGRFVQFRN